MCGIFGIIAKKGADCNRAAFHQTIMHLFKLSEPRGREAGGLVIASGDEAKIFKRSISPSRMLDLPEFNSFFQSSINNYKTDYQGKALASFAAIGHCRLVLSGSETILGNNQPISSNHCVGVHNGLITNDDEVWANHDDLVRTLDTDTEIAYRLIDKYVEKFGNFPEAISRAFSEFKGTAALGFLRNDAHVMILATNYGSIYTLALEDKGVFVFASELYILKTLLAKNPFLGKTATGQVRALQPSTCMIIPFDEARPKVHSLNILAKKAITTEVSKIPLLKFNDFSVRGAKLKRCTKCVLPHSYPFIEFDRDGVCNYCCDHKKQPREGRDALEKILEKHRRSDGKQDCIVAISGGRDSSYGLHLVKKELEMTPVAFTYDWGMVTDLARRNSARMCSELGVEHILRAADIPAKRRYIRKNIYAWLARPKLGMIPIFMAGDKAFFHYLRELRKETGIDLVLFCAGNELERTDFKTGFAGTRESAHRQRLFGMSTLNKVSLFAWYGAQYILNPRYFNESFIDTMYAYFSTFVAKDDFTYLYHYLPWDEDHINKTLIGQYGWEKAENSDNTWRIGDGYTSFINYIYHTVAGFSEYDTFRSNQIREGLIDRDHALELVAKDNEPKMEVLYDFAKHIGFNLEEILVRINSIQKLY